MGNVKMKEMGQGKPMKRWNLWLLGATILLAAFVLWSNWETLRLTPEQRALADYDPWTVEWQYLMIWWMVLIGLGLPGSRVRSVGLLCLLLSTPTPLLTIFYFYLALTHEGIGFGQVLWGLCFVLPNWLYVFAAGYGVAELYRARRKKKLGLE